MQTHHTINYIELPSTNLAASKQFFETVFEWTFRDYGPDYTAFTTATLEGGFFTSEKPSLTRNGASLVIFYSSDLEASLSTIREAGGTIIKPIFEFPGGRRFHFTDPGGSEFAVWSDVSPAVK